MQFHLNSFSNFSDNMWLCSVCLKNYNNNTLSTSPKKAASVTPVLNGKLSLKCYQALMIMAKMLLSAWLCSKRVDVIFNL